jgi:hypothetical protein
MAKFFYFFEQKLTEQKLVYQGIYLLAVEAPKEI